jgi:lipopolysaccharide transport system ATP-binding protein
MSDVAIHVENLGKRYRIGERQQYKALRDTLADAVYVPFRVAATLLNRRNGYNYSAPSGLSETEFWALKDVSFDIRNGEVVGIIGRNGAGKSTLLKILSRITKPTEGYIRINGRVGSLLEVGTGFHPELTGRENTYLNGAIIGMRKKEIDQKFDEIVAFAEIDKFIDTPVKFYSSGMYVRLAFAVAAHLEPDILVIDEVLAVGDMAFQEKCLGKMQDVTQQGRTIFFVSHNMASIQHLCSRALLLKSGQISADGVPPEIVKSYLSESFGAQWSSRVSVREWPDRATKATSRGVARIVQFEITDGNGQLTSAISLGGNVCFSIFAECYEPLIDPSFGILVHDEAGDPLLDLRSVHDGFRTGRVKGSVVVQVSLNTVGLYPGNYLLSPWIAASGYGDIDWVKHCCKLRVDPAPGPHGDLQLEPAYGKYWVASSWNLQ